MENEVVVEDDVVDEEEEGEDVTIPASPSARRWSRRCHVWAGGWWPLTPNLGFEPTISRQKATSTAD